MGSLTGLGKPGYLVLVARTLEELGHHGLGSITGMLWVRSSARPDSVWARRANLVET